MAASAGRRTTLTWGGIAIGGVKEKGLKLGGDPIDITSDDDNGWRTLLEESAQQQVDLSVSGVTKSRALMAAIMNGNRTATAVWTYHDGATLTGQFYLASYEDKAPFNDAMSFDAQLQSTGEVVYDPDP